MKLARLTNYPVKSMTGHDLTKTELGPYGLLGDRRWAVVHSSGQVATRREMPELAHLHAVSTDFGISLSYIDERIDVPVPEHAPATVKVFSTRVDGVLDAGNYASHFLSSALKHCVRLVYFPEEDIRPVAKGFAPTPHFTGFSDEFPVLITSMPSLFSLNAELQHPVEMRRFRPNIVIDGDFEPWTEDSWRLIRIGSTVLRIVKPCARCVMVTQDPKSGEILDKAEPLETLRRIHRASNGKIIFGQNAVVETQGAIALGDEVEVLESGPSNLTVA
jgi:uncharacterized protein YcbX